MPQNSNDRPIIQLTPEQAREIISYLHNEFSTKDFVAKLAVKYEYNYVSALFDCPKGPGSAFHTVYLEISRLLFKNQGELKIEYVNEIDTGECEFWCTSTTAIWRKNNLFPRGR